MLKLNALFGWKYRHVMPRCGVWQHEPTSQRQLLNVITGSILLIGPRSLILRSTLFSSTSPPGACIFVNTSNSWHNTVLEVLHVLTRAIQTHLSSGWCPLTVILMWNKVGTHQQRETITLRSSTITYGPRVWKLCVRTVAILFIWTLGFKNSWWASY